MGFSTENAKQGIQPYWWISIEGLRKRYGSYQPSWNPADSGTNQYIDTHLASVPNYGSQEVDPLNGECSIMDLDFSLQDIDGDITDLLAVSNTPYNFTYLTATIDDDDTVLPVIDTTGFPSSGDIFLDRETIHYTNHTSTSTSDTATILTGQTPENPGSMSDTSVYDTARTEDEDWWVGAVITFSSAGANNGEQRTIIRSVKDDPYSGESNYTLYWDSEDPLPTTVSVLDTYSITEAPRRLRSTGVTGSTWTGGVLEITTDPNNPENVGEVRYVKSFDDTNDIFELYEPLPSPADASTQFSITRYYFYGLTRGMYNSEAKTHSVLDKHGGLTQIPVSDHVPFIKTRRVWVYENRVGCVEADAKKTSCILDDYSLESNGQVYNFACSGSVKFLSKKLLRDTIKAEVGGYNVWGGELVLNRAWDDTWSARPAMKDGTFGGFTVTEIYAEKHEIPSVSSMNIKIGDEILHVDVDTQLYHLTSYITGIEYRSLWKLKLAEESLDLSHYTDYDGWLKLSNTQLHILGVYNRGLFANYIGNPYACRGWVGGVGVDIETISDLPPVINKFIQEHKVGDLITQVCVCDDTNNSDFPQYDKIYHDTITGIFSVGDTITGSLSNATSVYVDAGSDDAGSYFIVINRDGYYNTNGETLTNGSATCDCIGYDFGLWEKNNAINVLLQLLMSTGTPGTNGLYDTLPDGFGLGLTSDDINVTKFEEMRDRYFGNINIKFVIHEPIPFKEWAEDNICKFLQTFFFQDADGKISMEYLYTYEEAYQKDIEESIVDSIDSDHIEAYVLPNWSSGKEPVTQVVLKYNKHPVKDDYFGSMNIIFGAANRYYEGYGKTIEIESSVLYLRDDVFGQVTPNSPLLPEIIGRLINPIWSRHSSHPCPVITLRCPYQDRTFQIGDVVKLSHDELPNLKTGTRGWSDEYAQIMGMQLNATAGSVELTLWQIGVFDQKYGRFAPSAMVASASSDTPSAGKTTVTLYSYQFNIDVKDYTYFEAGDEVCFVTSNTYEPVGGVGSLETATIESVSTDTIVLDQNLTNNPSDGDIMEFAPYNNSPSDRTARKVYMSANNGLLGTAEDNAFTYR